MIAVFKTTVYDDTGFKYYLFANAETEEDFQGNANPYAGIICSAVGIEAV